MIDRSPSAPLSEATPLRERTFPVALSRLASLSLAIVLLLLLALFPGVALRGDAQLTQAVMPVLLIGIGASFAHGLGWRPRNAMLATAVGPFVAWPLTLAAFAFLAFGGDHLV